MAVELMPIHLLAAEADLTTERGTENVFSGVLDSPEVQIASSTQGQQQQQQQQQQLEAMLAAAGSSLNRAHAALNQAEAPTTTAAAGFLEPEGACPASANIEGLRQRFRPGQEQQPSATLRGLSTLGTAAEDVTPQTAAAAEGAIAGGGVHYTHALTAAVQGTQLFRFLLAALLAYAAVRHYIDFHALHLRPLLVLWVLDVSLILSAAAALYYLKPGALLRNAALQSSTAVPWRLRQVNLIALVPGLQEIMNVMTGYQQFAAALYADAAAFLVTTALLGIQ